VRRRGNVTVYQSDLARKEELESIGQALEAYSGDYHSKPRRKVAEMVSRKRV